MNNSRLLSIGIGLVLRDFSNRAYFYSQKKLVTNYYVQSSLFVNFLRYCRRFAFFACENEITVHRNNIISANTVKCFFNRHVHPTFLRNTKSLLLHHSKKHYWLEYDYSTIYSLMRICRLASSTGYNKATTKLTTLATTINNRCFPVMLRIEHDDLDIFTQSKPLRNFGGLLCSKA